MLERNKLAVVGGFFVLWGAGMMGLGVLIIDQNARRVFLGIGIMFGVLGLGILLLYVFANSGPD